MCRPQAKRASLKGCHDCSKCLLGSAQPRKVEPGRRRRVGLRGCGASQQKGDDQRTPGTWPGPPDLSPLPECRRFTGAKPQEKAFRKISGAFRRQCYLTFNCIANPLEFLNRIRCVDGNVRQTAGSPTAPVPPGLWLLCLWVWAAPETFWSDLLRQRSKSAGARTKLSSSRLRRTMSY